MKPADARVVLTGATGGIGESVARALLRGGASVMPVSRSAQRLAALCDTLCQGEPQWRQRLAPQVLDINDAAGVTSLSAAASAWRANVLINNAGVPSFGSFETLDATQMAEVIHTNLLVPMRLTQALLPALRQQASAQVIQVGSALGRLGLPGYAAYCASKFGLRGFTEALRRELAGTPVKVQYLGPRSTRTRFNDARVEAYNRATKTQMDSAQVVAEALLALLVSEAAEKFIGFPEKLAVRLNGLAPTLLDGAFGEHRRQISSPQELARTLS
jgi:short-subunit dehydrogenase